MPPTRGATPVSPQPFSVRPRLTSEHRTPPPSGDAMKLLIVDDDIWLCSAFSRGLVKMGHFARTATSVDMALSLIEQEAPHAVLTDLDLGPGGNGVDLIARLRAAGSPVPALLMTGSDPA